jgi:hypothetical protein
MKLAVMILLLLNLCLYAQDDVVFKQQFKANTTYYNYAKIITKTVLNYDAPQKTLDSLRSMGAVIPMIEVFENKIYFTTRTGEIDSSGRIPVKGKLDSAFSAKSVNGVMADSYEGSSKLDTTFRKWGYFVDGKPQIESENLEDSVEKDEGTAKDMLLQISGANNFPGKALHAGESFNVVVPLDVPSQNGELLKLVSVLKYTLEKIDTGIAEFDIHETVNSKDTTDSSTTVEGLGTGNLFFSIAEHEPIYRKMDLKMNSTFTSNTAKAMISTDINIEQKMNELNGNKKTYK